MKYVVKKITSQIVLKQAVPTLQTTVHFVNFRNTPSTGENHSFPT